MFGRAHPRVRPDEVQEIFMQMLPIDLTEIVAIVLGISIVLVPVIGLTARFALGPAVHKTGFLPSLFQPRSRCP